MGKLTAARVNGSPGMGGGGPIFWGMRRFVHSSVPRRRTKALVRALSLATRDLSIS